MNVRTARKPKSSNSKAALVAYPIKKFDKGSFSDSVALKRFSSNIIAIPSKSAPRSKIPAGAIYATGKRKASIARVWMWEKDQNADSFVKIGKKDCSAYFSNTLTYLSKIQRPFDVTGLQLSSFCVYSSLSGGGISMKSEALALGLAKIIADKFPDLKSILKKEKLLTRDSRIVEPKKTGLRGARKKEQYSKR